MMNHRGAFLPAEWLFRAALFTALSLFCAVVILPWLDLMSRGHGILSGLAYLAARPFCHQIAERSFCWAGVPLAMCARCSGMVFGLWAGGLVAGLGRGFNTRLSAGRFWLLLGLSPLVLDGLLNAAGIFYSPNWWRALTGLGAGAALGFGLLPAWNQMWGLFQSGPARKALYVE